MEYKKSFRNFNDRERENGSKDFDLKNPKVRIAKRLAELGVASRRDCEKLISEGKVKINNIESRDLAFLVDYNDTLSVNGKAVINKAIKTKIYLMHKPSGYVTTNFDPEGRKTIFELIPEKFGRLMSIGRLDINTEGLILLTNNGEAARILELPATGLKRVYKVRVFGEVKLEDLEKLKYGITIDGIRYGTFAIIPSKIEENKAWLTIIIHEGKNREIKNVLGHFGLKVTRLIRVQYGPYKLLDLPSGCIRESQFEFDMGFYKRKLFDNYNRNQSRYRNIHVNDLPRSHSKKENKN